MKITTMTMMTIAMMRMTTKLVNMTILVMNMTTLMSTCMMTLRHFAALVGSTQLTFEVGSHCEVNSSWTRERIERCLRLFSSGSAWLLVRTAQ